MGQMAKENEEVELIAKNLVSDVFKGRDGYVWRGGMGGRVKHFHWILPEWFFKCCLRASRGVYQFKVL